MSLRALALISSLLAVLRRPLDSLRAAVRGIREGVRRGRSGEAEKPVVDFSPYQTPIEEIIEANSVKDIGDLPVLEFLYEPECVVDVVEVEIVTHPTNGHSMRTYGFSKGPASPTHQIEDSQHGNGQQEHEEQGPKGNGRA